MMASKLVVCGRSTWGAGPGWLLGQRDGAAGALRGSDFRVHYEGRTSVSRAMYITLFCFVLYYIYNLTRQIVPAEPGRACVRACVCVRVRACACVRACARVRVHHDPLTHTHTHDSHCCTPDTEHRGSTVDQHTGAHHSTQRVDRRDWLVGLPLSGSTGSLSGSTGSLSGSTGSWACP
jgi:hypothetical protein